jgi:hypothetical protein
VSRDLIAAQRSAVESLAGLTGFEHAVFVQSGTAALEIVVSVLTAPGARVTVPALGCWTVPHAVAKVGREPVFVDVDACWGACPTVRARAGAAATVMIDPWGAPGDHRAAGRRVPGGVAIADVTHAPGARVDGEPAAARFDAAILSFGFGKPLGIGGGGCALFRDARAAEEAATYLRFGFVDGQWTKRIDRYTFSPLLFPALAARLSAAAGALDLDVEAAIEARRVLSGGRFAPNELRPGGRFGLWSVQPIRAPVDLGLSPRDIESVAVSSGVPLVRHPVGPAYLEPAWGGGGRRPRCPRAEAIAKSLLCFERIGHPDEIRALQDFLQRVAADPGRFRAPFRLPRARGPLSAELQGVADRGRLARSLDGGFWLLDERGSRKIPLDPGDAARVQQLQRGGQS